jgi:hypothetical protein
MKKEYDFSNGVKGKFFFLNANHYFICQTCGKQFPVELGDKGCCKGLPAKFVRKVRKKKCQ